MARIPREHRLETREARARLKARGEPYWRQIVPGTFLGLRKGKKAATWIARQRQGEGYVEQRIGTADDLADADGTVVLSYAQAVAIATTMQLEAREPRPRHFADGVTLNAAGAVYFDEHLAGRGSEKDARRWWAMHVERGIGKRLVSAMTAEGLRRWHRDLAQTPPVRRGGKVLPFDPADPDQVRARRSTANRILTIVKAALNYCWENDRLPADQPAWWQKVKPFPLGDDPPPRMLERDEITRLLNAAAPDLRRLLSGALLTGARRGELLALQVRDYSPDHGQVRIYQSKTGKTLLQPLTPEGATFFDNITAGRAGTDPMFTRDDGRAWGRSDVIRPMNAAVAAAKLEDVSFKTTRGTYGKLLLLATKDIELVARALGHSDSRITRKHYAQLLPSEVARGVARLPKLGVATESKVSPIGKKRQAG